MKKVGKYLVFVLVLFFSFFVSVHAEEQIEIKSINCDNMYNGELRENVGVEINGLTIKVDDSYFYKEGDYFKCTLVVKNNADDDVTVDSESISSQSDENVTFELKTEGENLIKKGEEKTYNLEINYIKAVTEDRALENVVEIKLLNEEVKVPDTNVYVILTAGVLLLLIVSIGIVVYTKKSAVLMLPIVFALLVVPAGYSLMKVSIKLENKIYIEVEPRYKVIYNYSNYIKEEDEANFYEITQRYDTVYPVGEENYFEVKVSIVDGYYKEGDVVVIKNITTNDLKCLNWNSATDSCDNAKLEEKEVITSSSFAWAYDKTLAINQNDPLVNEYGIKVFNCDNNNNCFTFPSSSILMPGHDIFLYSKQILS